MSSHAIFYQISTSTPLNNSDLSAVENRACELVVENWRSGKKVLVWCADQAQAERLDEALWALDPEDFIPHNLAGEPTQAPTPVEIAWVGKRNQQRRDVVINLAPEVPEFVTSFTLSLDFVPMDEAEKALARERYKYYRTQGWNLSMAQ